QHIIAARGRLGRSRRQSPRSTSSVQEKFTGGPFERILNSRPTSARHPVYHPAAPSCGAEAISMRALTVIASLVFAVSAFGQGQLSSMVGTLTDPEGRAVAGAPVQARDGAGAVFKATTNARGEYVLNRLPPGTYALVVPAIGFSLDRFEQREIAVAVAQVLR